MHKILFIIVVLFGFISTTGAKAEDIYQFKNVQQTNQFQHLIREVRCIVCQNQSLAESSAPLAKDLRNKIHLLILANQSDQEIKEYLVKRYGEFILLKPHLKPQTFLLWFFPIILVGIALVILRKITRQNFSKRSDFVRIRPSVGAQNIEL